MKRLLLFALLALVCAGGAFAQGGNPAGAYTSSATGGLSFVSALPALCTPGVTASVQLNVAPYQINYCSAPNVWSALTNGGTITPTAQYSLGMFTASGVATTIGQACSPPTANGTYVLLYAPNASAAVAASCPEVGMTSATISGAATTYTVAYTDVSGQNIQHDQAATGAVTVTLPTPTTLTNPNAVFRYTNASAQSDTITPATWTIQKNTTAAAASISVPSGTSCLVYVDPFNASVWDASCVSGLAGGTAFPITVSGTVNSGGIPYFNSTTQESSSAALGANGTVFGGGAGAAPFTDTNLLYSASVGTPDGGCANTASGYKFNTNSVAIVAALANQFAINTNTASCASGATFQMKSDYGTNDLELKLFPGGGSGYDVIQASDNSAGHLGLLIVDTSTNFISMRPHNVETFQFLALTGGGVKTTGSVATTCTFTSGGGTSPSCTVDTGSNNLAGIIIATTGSGSPGSTGTITLSFTGNMGTNKPVCEYQASDAGAGAWSSLPVMKDKTPAVGSDLFTWTNGTSNAAATALTASTAYWINYHCFGK